jgi:hypothetical protein
MRSGVGKASQVGTLEAITTIYAHAGDGAISASTAGAYVGDIRARRREAQKVIAYRLHLLGWTQEEIAQQVGVAQNHYARDFLHQFPALENGVKKVLDSGIPHLDVAERFHLPLVLVHALDLQGRTDQQRCKRLGITLQPYDVWTFPQCDDQERFKPASLLAMHEGITARRFPSRCHRWEAPRTRIHAGA